MLRPCTLPTEQAGFSVKSRHLYHLHPGVKSLNKSFAEGIMSARPEHRSDFVIKCSAEHVRKLSGMNPGALKRKLDLLLFAASQ